MKTTSTSQREAQVIKEILDREIIIFTPQHIKRILNTSQTNTNRILQNMHRKKQIKRIQKGKYILKQNWDQLDIYEIIPHLTRNSYLAYYSALHYHHMTEQVPQQIYIASTTRKRNHKINKQKIKYVKIKPEDYFGYEKHGHTIVSDPEKTILDCLTHPKYAGGIKEIIKALEHKLNQIKIIEYTLKQKNPTVAARLGYLLQQKKQLKPQTKKILKKQIKNYVKLDPTQKKTNPNPEWKLYVNIR